MVLPATVIKDSMTLHLFRSNWTDSLGYPRGDLGGQKHGLVLGGALACFGADLSEMFKVWMWTLLYSNGFQGLLL